MAGYELLERIGAGGMAEIFRGRATAIGGFEKPVAIKKILPHLAQEPKFVRMLIAEANVLASLRHRNIVQIFDVGLSDHGEYFLVMEYVDGVDLGVVYDRLVFPVSRGVAPRRLASDLVLFIGSEVCEALDQVHRAVDADHRVLNLIHRDVSPANVMLSYAGEVKLTDFGISKRAEQASVVTSIKGKFAYMAPEQAKAQANLDRTCDIYSLGIILYELLLGRRLFSALVDWDALDAVRSGNVPRPTDIDPTFSRELEAILLKALAYHPRDRFPSAAALGAALRDFRYSAATSAGDPAKEIGTLLLALRPRKPLFEKVLDHDTFVRIETAAGFGDTGRRRAVGDDSGATTIVRELVGENGAARELGEGEEADATAVDDPVIELARAAASSPRDPDLSPGLASAAADSAALSSSRPGLARVSSPGLQNRPRVLEKIDRAPSGRSPAARAPSPPMPRFEPSRREPGIPGRLLLIIFAILLVTMAIVALAIARLG